MQASKEINARAYNGENTVHASLFHTQIVRLVLSDSTLIGTTGGQAQAVWKSATTTPGAQCVTMTGDSKRMSSCADSWAIDPLVCYSVIYSIIRL